MSCINYIATFNDKIEGYVKFHQCNKNQETKVEFNLKGFGQNKIHAIHIHEYGDLRDGCKSLGAHLNLTNKEHGSIFIDPHESHTGDLVNNIESDDKGQVIFYYYDPRLNLFNDINNYMDQIIKCIVRSISNYKY